MCPVRSVTYVSGPDKEVTVTEHCPGTTPRSNLFKTQPTTRHIRP
jgi:hypothetical protein